MDRSHTFLIHFPPHYHHIQVEDCLSDPLNQSVSSDLGVLPVLIDLVGHPCTGMPYEVRSSAMDALAAVCKHRPSLAMVRLPLIGYTETFLPVLTPDVPITACRRSWTAHNCSSTSLGSSPACVT